MKSFKLIITLVVLYLPFGAFSQDYYASATDYTIDKSIEEEKQERTESIKDQEYELVRKVKHALIQQIEYPYEARENGEEGLIRAVVLISADHSTAKLKIAKSTFESLDNALILAFKNLKLDSMIPTAYERRRAIPVKINFELD